MLTEAQLEQRLDYLTGSDAAVVTNLSPYKTRLELWQEKTRRTVQEDISHLNHIKFGTYFEDGVAQWFEAESGKKLKPKESKMLTHPTIPFMAGNVDFEIDGENAILECKTAASDRDWGDGENIIPPYYLMQIAHYCAVGGYDRAYLAVVFSAKREMRYYIYERNQALEEKLIKAETDFWINNVQADVAPEPVNEKDIISLYPAANADPIIGDYVIIDKVSEMAKLAKQIKEIEEMKDNLKTEVALYMKDHDALLAPDGTLVATWKYTKTSRRLDTEELRKKHKGLYEEFLKETGAQRRFLIKGAINE